MARLQSRSTKRRESCLVSQAFSSGILYCVVLVIKGCLNDDRMA